MLRLRVISNSDMLCDQRLKLAVRDSILECSRDIFDGCGQIGDAISRASRHTGEFERTAARVIEANGFDYEVRVTLCRDWFPTRRYEASPDGSGGAILPAGTYNTLRVEIGQARGHNWWCVMFPMMCVPSSGQQGMEDVLSEGEYRITESDGYDVRFKCVEIIERMRRNQGIVISD